MGYINLYVQQYILYTMGWLIINLDDYHIGYNT